MKVTTDSCLFGAWCAAEIKKTEALNLLDIGAGSGLLSLMIAQQNLVNITAVEIDNDAAEQAKENIAASPWAESINVVVENILTTNFEFAFDVIVSNPPFYENELQSETKAKNIAHHSHALTLSNLFSFVDKNLSPGGIFFVLLPYKRLNEIELLLKNDEWYVTQKVIVSPTVQHKPFRLILALAKQPSTNVESNVAVKDNENKYTAEFVSLLKDYYLHL